MGHRGHLSQRQCRLLESYELDEVSIENHLRCKKRAANATAASSPTKDDLGCVATYCGAETSSRRLFGVIFPNRSYPMDASNFTQVDPTHWILDMGIFVGESYNEVKEICLFLVNEYSIPPEKALTLHVQSPGSQFQYCGAVCKACPSAVLSLLWSRPGGQMQITAPNSEPVTAKIGLAVEDVLTLPTFNVGQQQQIEAMATRIAENFFNCMQSFWSLGRDKLLSVPADTLNQWFKNFQEKLQRDSDYMKMLLT